MIISVTAVLIALSVILVLGLANFLSPLLKERRRGKKTLHGITGLPPHWLIGHMKEV